MPLSKRGGLLRLNTYLECPGPCTQPLDPASVAHAIWNYKINRARSFNASDAVITIYFYDLDVISIDNWIIGELSQPDLPTILIRNPTNKNYTMSTLRP